MIPRCSDCKQPTIHFTKYMEWLRLFYFLDFLRLQGDITNELHDDLFDCLMNFKQYADEETDKAETP